MDPGEGSSRNRIQSTTLLDAINEHQFDAAFGGARRDEDKARAKERVLSFRDRFGRWDPRRQRPELWQLYQGKVNAGEHLRAFPLSDWTELDIWQYIERERIELPSIYFAHEREVVLRDGMLLAVSAVGRPRAGDEVAERRVVRYRTVGTRPCTGAVALRGHAPSRAIIEEISVADGLGARRDARRRPVQRDRHGGPQARGLLLMAREAAPVMDLLRFATVGSVDDGKSHAHRPAARRHPAALRRPARGRGPRLGREGRRRPRPLAS